jgi:hypothetical protein
MKNFLALIMAPALLMPAPLFPGLLINEFVTATDSDWVELFFQSPVKEKIDISGLYVTAYYGTNEKLGTEPITLYSYDRPETPWDDRFAVVHLAAPGMADETDRTGDTNHNGYLDIYCNSYSGSLWNTEGVIAIDADDDPGNGGIIDFVFYSNRDGNPNKTILSYIESAQAQGQWQACASLNVQLCGVDIGQQGLKSFMSISRTGTGDTNSMKDFAATNFQTPGRPNVLSMNSGKKKLFSSDKKRITILPGYDNSGKGKINLTVFESCNIRLRIFSSTGQRIFESPLHRSVAPGGFSLQWSPLGGGHALRTGFYIGLIEASSPSMRMSQSERIFIICSRYR